MPPAKQNVEDADFPMASFRNINFICVKKGEEKL